MSHVATCQGIADYSLIALQAATRIDTSRKALLVAPGKNREMEEEIIHELLSLSL